MKKLILLMLMVLALASFASAYDDGDRFLYYGFDTGSGNTAFEKVSNLNGTIANAGWTTTAGAHINNSAINMSSASSIVYNHSNTSSYLQDYAISIWVYYEKLNGDDKYNILRLDNGVNDDNNFVHFRIDDRAGQDTGDIYFRGAGLTTDTFELPLPTEDVWTHYLINIKANTWFEVYENGVHIDNTTITDAFAGGFCWTSGGGAQTCDETSGFEGDIGAIDNLAFFNKTFTQTEVNAEYNGGAGVYYDGAAPPAPPAVVSSLNLSAPLPANNTQYNTELLNFNLTANSTADFNCSVYLDDVLNDTTTGYTAGENVAVDFNIAFSATEEATHTFFVECWNGINATNSSTNTFFIDNVVPNIYWYTPTSTNTTFVNLDFDSNIYTNVSVEDPNLYSYYYNITYLNGTSIYNISNTSLIGLTTADILNTFDMSGYLGVFKAVGQVCDGHTNNKIKDIKKITKTKDKIKFEDDRENVEIALFDNNNGDYTFTSKEEDRYSFKFKTKTSKTKEKFLVTSEEYIDILDGKTGYPGHLVTGHRWIDFDIPNIKSVVVTRVSDKAVYVEVELFSATTAWQFNSIGELNCVTEEKQFTTINVSNVDYEVEAIEASTPSFTLTINITGLALTSVSGNFTYNGTNYVSTITNDSTQINFTNSVTLPLQDAVELARYFHWDYAINGNVYNTSEYLQNTYHFSLTNCTDTGNQIITYLLSNEDDLYYIDAGTIDVDFDYYDPNGNVSDVRTFGHTFENTYNATLCIVPTFVNLISNGYVIHTTSAYAHRYFLVNANLTNETNSIVNLYNFESTTDKNTLKVNIVDEYYNPVSNIIVKLLRYYPSGTHQNSSEVYAHTWEVVQMDRSDEFGETAFHVSDSGDTDYYFIMESNNSVIKQSATLKLLCPDASDCEVTFQVDAFTEAANPFSIFTDYVYTYNNETEMIDVTWSDTTGLTQEIRFVVSQVKADGYLTICDNTYNTIAGAFSCNTTGYDGMIKVSGYRTASPLATFLSELFEKNKEGFGDVLSGEGALWGALMMVTIVVASAASAVGVIVMSIVALIVLFIMGITNIVTLTFVVLGVIMGLIIAFKLKR